MVTDSSIDSVLFLLLAICLRVALLSFLFTARYISKLVFSSFSLCR